MKIAQIAPLWENIPPLKYGGTQRVISPLTEELVKRGHEVTLFACGTSQTSAKLVSIYPRPLYRDGIPWSNITYPLLNITEALDHHKEFDILHFHLDKSNEYIALPLIEAIKHKVIITLHFPYPTSQGRMDRHRVLQKYKDLQYISISNSQRKGGENLNWKGTVYNGLDLSPYHFHATSKNYFVWLGKFNPDKGVKEAISAARKAGVNLLLAGAIDKLEKEDYEYYQTIKPLIDGEQIKYVGEVDDQQKNDLLGNARAFLNPIQWNEPFGLVMAESMATGTPVISFSRGAAPEVIVDKETGFLVHTVDEMVMKINEVDQIDRKNCRSRVEKYFSAQSMTNQYEQIYQTIINN